MTRNRGLLAMRPGWVPPPRTARQRANRIRLMQRARRRWSMCECCGAEHAGFVCTRHARHAGAHQAHGPSDLRGKRPIFARWGGPKRKRIGHRGGG